MRPAGFDNRGRSRAQEAGAGAMAGPGGSAGGATAGRSGSAPGGSSAPPTPASGIASSSPRAPITASTVRHVAATTPRTGTTMNMPSTPAIADPAGMPTRTTAGWRWTVLPYTMGLTMLPVTMLNTIVQTAMIAISAGVPIATVSRNAMPVEMNP